MKRAQRSNHGTAKSTRQTRSQSSTNRTASKPKHETISRFFKKIENTPTSSAEVAVKTPGKLDCSNVSDSDFVSPPKVRKLAKIFTDVKENVTKVTRSRKAKKVLIHDEEQKLMEIGKTSDVNMEHLQLAMALSKSMEPELTAAHEDEYPTTQQITEKVRNELQNFRIKPSTYNKGSSVEPAKSTAKKKSKYRYVKPKLFTRTVEEREKIIEEKIGDILLHAIGSYEQKVENDLNSFELMDMCDENRRIFRLSNQATQKADFYVKSLNFEESISCCGCLLRKWDSIPGRDRSPSRDLTKKTQNAEILRNINELKTSESLNMSKKCSINIENEVIELSQILKEPLSSITNKISPIFRPKEIDNDDTLKTKKKHDKLIQSDGGKSNIDEFDKLGVRTYSVYRDSPEYTRTEAVFEEDFVSVSMITPRNTEVVTGNINEPMKQEVCVSSTTDNFKTIPEISPKISENLLRNSNLIITEKNQISSNFSTKIIKSRNTVRSESPDLFESSEEEMFDDEVFFRVKTPEMSDDEVFFTVKTPSLVVNDENSGNINYKHTENYSLQQLPRVNYIHRKEEILSVESSQMNTSANKQSLIDANDLKENNSENQLKTQENSFFTSILHALNKNKLRKECIKESLYAENEQKKSSVDSDDFHSLNEDIVDANGSCSYESLNEYISENDEKSRNEFINVSLKADTERKTSSDDSEDLHSLNENIVDDNGICSYESFANFDDDKNDSERTVTSDCNNQSVVENRLFENDINEERENDSSKLIEHDINETSKDNNLNQFKPISDYSYKDSFHANHEVTNHVHALLNSSSFANNCKSICIDHITSPKNSMKSPQKLPSPIMENNMAHSASLNGNQGSNQMGHGVIDLSQDNIDKNDAEKECIDLSQDSDNDDYMKDNNVGRFQPSFVRNLSSNSIESNASTNESICISDEELNYSCLHATPINYKRVSWKYEKLALKKNKFAISDSEDDDLSQEEGTSFVKDDCDAEGSVDVTKLLEAIQNRRRIKVNENCEQGSLEKNKSGISDNTYMDLEEKDEDAMENVSQVSDLVVIANNQADKIEKCSNDDSVNDCSFDSDIASVSMEQQQEKERKKISSKKDNRQTSEILSNQSLENSKIRGNEVMEVEDYDEDLLSNEFDFPSVSMVDNSDKNESLSSVLSKKIDSPNCPNELERNDVIVTNLDNSIENGKEKHTKNKEQTLFNDSFSSFSHEISLKISHTPQNPEKNISTNKETTVGKEFAREQTIFNTSFPSFDHDNYDFCGQNYVKQSPQIEKLITPNSPKQITTIEKDTHPEGLDEFDLLVNSTQSIFTTEKPQSRRVQELSHETIPSNVLNTSNMKANHTFEDTFANLLEQTNVLQTLENVENIKITPKGKVSGGETMRHSKTFITPITKPLNTPKTPLDGLFVKTNNVTPMPRYDNMTTPQIHAELDKIGVKCMKRRRGVQMLKHVYNSMHIHLQDDIDGDNLRQDSKRRKKLNYDTNEPACSSSKLVTQIVQNDVKIEINPKLAESESFENLIFERIQSKRMKSCQLPLHIAWHNFLCMNRDIWQNVLLYEPLQVEVLYAMFKELGFKYHIQDMITFFDRKCITIRIKRK